MILWDILWDYTKGAPAVNNTVRVRSNRRFVPIINLRKVTDLQHVPYDLFVWLHCPLVTLCSSSDSGKLFQRSRHINRITRKERESGGESGSGDRKYHRGVSSAPEVSRHFYAAPESRVIDTSSFLHRSQIHRKPIINCIIKCAIVWKRNAKKKIGDGRWPSFHSIDAWTSSWKLVTVSWFYCVAVYRY